MKFKRQTKSAIAATVILSAVLLVCFWETGAYVAATASEDRPADSQIPAPFTDVSVIGDGDKAHVISGEIKNNHAMVISEPETDMYRAGVLNSVPYIKDITFNIVKTISDERCLCIFFSMKANDGAFLNPDGRFADIEVLFPGKMMSGAYQQYFLERQDGAPKNELEGVIYADWQVGGEAKGLELRFLDWQEKWMFQDVKVTFDVSEMAEEAGENTSRLPFLYDPAHDLYLWQPGNADIPLPYSGAAICNAGWEDGILQIVLKCSRTEAACQIYQNWYFVDTRTDEVIRPESHTWFHTQDQFEPAAENPDDYYIWQFVSVDKEALPYLEMHWGGKEIFLPGLPGEWKVRIDETPVTEKSKLFAEDVNLSYAGKELSVDRIECSSLSLGVYFTDYIDSTTGILGAFAAFDTDGTPIDINWGFTADADGSGCMIWTRFAEPVDPERICLLTFDGEPVYRK